MVFPVPHSQYVLWFIIPPSCVLIAPHLFQFSSFDFLLFKSPVSPVSCVGCYMSSWCFIKALLKIFLRVSSLLALPSESLTEQPTENQKKRRFLLTRFCFPGFEKFFVFFCFFLAPAAMEIAARFIALAHRDLPFLEYSREFCRLAAATTLDDATILSLFWHGANSHRPVDLPDTTGLKWREGILRCLESVRPRARPAPRQCPPVAAPRQCPPVAAPRQCPPVAAPRKCPPVRTPEPAPCKCPPVRTPEPAPRKCPPVCTPEPAPRQRTPEPAPRQRTPEPAPRQRPLVPAPAERPQVPAPAERPQVPAPAERPQESALPERPQESMPPVRPLVPDGALISPKEILGGG